MIALERRVAALGRRRAWRWRPPAARRRRWRSRRSPGPLVLFAALPLLLWLLDATPRPRAAFALGWAAGAGHFAAALFWIVDPFLVEPEVYGWMAPFALVGMAGGLALFWAAPFALARAASAPGPRPRPPPRRPLDPRRLRPLHAS